MKKDVIVIDGDIFVYCNSEIVDELFNIKEHPKTEVWIAQRDSLWGDPVERRINFLIGRSEKIKRKPICDIFKERKKVFFICSYNKLIKRKKCDIKYINYVMMLGFVI